MSPSDSLSDQALTVAELTTLHSSIERWPYTPAARAWLAIHVPQSEEFFARILEAAKTKRRQLTLVEVQALNRARLDETQAREQARRDLYQPGLDESAPADRRRCENPAGCNREVKPRTQNIIIGGEPIYYDTGTRPGQPIRDGNFMLGKDGETVLLFCGLHITAEKARRRGTGLDPRAYPFWRAVEVAEENKRERLDRERLASTPETRREEQTRAALARANERAASAPATVSADGNGREPVGLRADRSAKRGFQRR